MWLASCLFRYFRESAKSKKYVQSWVPYIIFGGTLSWVGFIKAHLHPALALVPIVPFMPHEEAIKEHHDSDSEEGEEVDQSVEGREGEDGRQRLATAGMSTEQLFSRHLQQREESNMLTGGTHIQAGLYAGLAGHSVDSRFKVQVEDEDGNTHTQVSTLDGFEHFCKIYVDFGLGLFAFVNAGIVITGIGQMTILIPLSLLVGKFCGILLMYKVSKRLGFLPPLGIRTKHIYLIGLIASIGLTVAIFVSDVAFTNKKLQGDAKLGAILSAGFGFLSLGVGQFFDFHDENIHEEKRQAVIEELKELHPELEGQINEMHASMASTPIGGRSPALTSSAVSVAVELDSPAENAAVAAAMGVQAPDATATAAPNTEANGDGKWA